MGISRPAYEEVQTIIGRLPTVDELSTLLAMWQSQGERQGLLSWLKGQPHAAERHEYLENDLEPQSKEIKEPRVKECIAIARSMFGGKEPAANNIFTHTNGEKQTSVHRGDALYMIGDVSEFFVDSEYGRRRLSGIDTRQPQRQRHAVRLPSYHVGRSVRDSARHHRACIIGIRHPHLPRGAPRCISLR